MSQHFTVVGIGSNIAPETNIPTAIEYLRSLIPDPSCAPIYQSPAFGFDGNVFHNTGVMGYTPFELAKFEQQLKQIEQTMGHNPSASKKQNRIIDLDIYLFDTCVSNTLPRQDIVNYPFAAQILCDLMPNAKHPTTHELYCGLARKLKANQWLTKL